MTNIRENLKDQLDEFVKEYDFLASRDHLEWLFQYDAEQFADRLSSNLSSILEELKEEGVEIQYLVELGYGKYFEQLITSSIWNSSYFVIKPVFEDPIKDFVEAFKVEYFSHNQSEPDVGQTVNEMQVTVDKEVTLEDNVSEELLVKPVVWPHFCRHLIAI